jgi:AraC-like DNA-binding protein
LPSSRSRRSICRCPATARASNAARHVRDTLGDAHTLAGVAKHAGASARTLERLFRSETGLSFGAWRQRARLIRSLQLLADGESVTRTAIAVGYESTSAFVAAFRRTIGTTPGQYFDRKSEVELL